MSFPILDLLSCVQQARSAFQAALPGLNAWLWPNNIGPTAKVLGGEEWNVFNRLDFVGKQAFVLFAEGKYLDAHGAEFNLPRKLAQAASGNIVITATGALAVAAGATFGRGDGMIATTASALSLAGAGTLSVPVVAPAAQASNTAPSTPMTILSGVTGAGAVGATAAVDSGGLSGGTDVEPDGPPKTSSLATYRGRILFRKRNPPQGGAPSDYVQWAVGVPGVTRVYVEKCWPAPGGVRIFPLFDQLFAASGGVADSAHIALVQQALAPDEPAAAAVTIVAPTAQPINVTVSGLYPNTTATQAAVIAELVDTFQRLGAASGGSTANPAMPYLATPQTFMADWIEQAVANAAGVISADVAATDTPIASGSIATLGTVSFV